MSRYCRMPLEGGRALCALIVATLMLTSAPALSVQTIEPHQARYKIKISIASGTLETDVRESAGGFAVNSVIKPTGFARLLTRGTIEESSTFSLASGGVRPSVYASKDTLSKEDKFMDFVFDWDLNAVSGTINDQEYHYDLDGEAHDRVSIQYQLMHNLLNGIESKNYAMLDGDEIKLLEISTLEPRQIKVPFGTFEAIGVRHQAANSKRITTLWCAEELGFLPVMIEQHRKGKRRVHAVLTDYAAGGVNEDSLGASN